MPKPETAPFSPGELATDGGENGLLDLLLVIAENARLLVFGPLLAGLAALGIAFPVGMGSA